MKYAASIRAGLFLLLLPLWAHSQEDDPAIELSTAYQSMLDGEGPAEYQEASADFLERHRNLLLSTLQRMTEGGQIETVVATASGRPVRIRISKDVLRQDGIRSLQMSRHVKTGPLPVTPNAPESLGVPVVIHVTDPPDSPMGRVNGSEGADATNCSCARSR